MITKSLHCVSLKVRNLPYYDGLTNVYKFLDAFEREVPKEHCFEPLDLALRLQNGGVRIKTISMDGANT